MEHSSTDHEYEALKKDFEIFHFCMEFAHKKTNSVTDDRKTNFGKIFDAARFVDSVSKFGHVDKSQEMVVLLVDVLSPVYLEDRITDQLRWAMRQIEFEMED